MTDQEIMKRMGEIEMRLEALGLAPIALLQISPRGVAIGTFALGLSQQYPTAFEAIHAIECELEKREAALGVPVLGTEAA